MKTREEVESIGEKRGRKNVPVPWFGLETLITQDHRL